MKKAFKAVSFLWLGAVLGAVFAFLGQLLLARALGPSAFGDFSAQFAIVNLIAPLAGAGVAQFWLLAFGREGFEALRWVKGSIRLSLGFSLIAVSFLLCLAVFQSQVEVSVFQGLLAFYLFGLVSNEIVIAKLQLEERYLQLAFWNVLPHFLRFLIVVVLAMAALPSSATAISVALGYFVVALSMTLFCLKEMRRMKEAGSFRLKGHSTENNCNLPDEESKSVLSSSWPFGVAAFFYFVYFQSDLVIVQRLVGSADAGHYNVALTILTAILIFPNVVYQKYLLPKIHRWANTDKKRFYDVYRKGNVIMLAIGACICAVGWLLAPLLVPFFFGARYVDSIFPVQLLLLSVPLIFTASSAGSTLVTSSHMRTKVVYMGIVALASLCLNFILVPRWGVVAAAWVKFFCNGLLLFLYISGARRLVFGKELRND